MTASLNITLPGTARLYLGVDLTDPREGRTVQAIGAPANGIVSVEFESNEAAELALVAAGFAPCAGHQGLVWARN